MTVRETHCVMHWMQLIYPVNIIHHKNNCGLDLSLASAFFDPKTKKNAPLCCFSPSHIDSASCGKHDRIMTMWWTVIPYSEEQSYFNMLHKLG